MDDEQRMLVMTALPALLRPQSDASEYLKQVVAFLFAVLRLPPAPFIDIRNRLFEKHNNIWEGRDLFSQFACHGYAFFQVTGETPESMLEIVKTFDWNIEKRHRLSPRNRVLLFFMWLRSYPSHYMLSLMFDISVTSVQELIDSLIPVFYNRLSTYITWPSIEEWNSIRGIWSRLPNAVGAIDGTSHEIYRPLIEPQEQYYSGYRHYHAIHTQIVVDNTGQIRYVESGFLGHQNDAQQFLLMRTIGQDLVFRADCVLLADKIYPNRYPVMTPYTRQQIARKQGRMKQKCRKLNRVIGEYRICVEHRIGDLKCYKVIGTLWRHPRSKLGFIIMLNFIH